MEKCIGCQKGIWLFAEGGKSNIPNSKEGELYHADLFGFGFVPCENADEIWPTLEKNDRGWLEPTSELKNKMIEQEYWWEDMMSLLNIVVDSPNTFLNEMIDGHRRWQQPCSEIENELLLLAENKGIEITEEDFYNLLKFKK